MQRLQHCHSHLLPAAAVAATATAVAAAVPAAAAGDTELTIDDLVRPERICGR